MIITPANRMFIAPEDKWEFSLTGENCQDKIDSVKPVHQTICLDKIPPRAGADLRVGNNRKACTGPHTSAPVRGCFSAHTAREAKAL
jgi:hypothetical protein